MMSKTRMQSSMKPKFIQKIPNNDTSSSLKSFSPMIKQGAKVGVNQLGGFTTQWVSPVKPLGIISRNTSVNATGSVNYPARSQGSLAVTYNQQTTAA